MAWPAEGHTSAGSLPALRRAAGGGKWRGGRGSCRESGGGRGLTGGGREKAGAEEGGGEHSGNGGEEAPVVERHGRGAAGVRTGAAKAAVGTARRDAARGSGNSSPEFGDGSGADALGAETLSSPGRGIGGGEVWSRWDEADGALNRGEGERGGANRSPKWEVGAAAVAGIGGVGRWGRGGTYAGRAGKETGWCARGGDVGVRPGRAGWLLRAAAAQGRRRPRGEDDDRVTDQWGRGGRERRERGVAPTGGAGGQ